MELCSDGHDEICFEGRYCPVCAAQEQIEDIQNKMYSLDEENGRLMQENNSLELDIVDLQNTIHEIEEANNNG